MMKRFRLFLTLFLLPIFSTLIAQIENDPCSAPCLDLSGTTIAVLPPADQNFPNINLPCSGGTSEDNPTWWTFVASKSSFTVNFSVSACTEGSSIQVGLFEGDDCLNVSATSCANCQTNGAVTMATIPGKQYWLQIDGCAESVCGFTLTYNPAEISGDPPAPIISGSLNTCMGTTVDYSASIAGGWEPDSWTWSIIPTNAGQIIGQGSKNIEIKWNQKGSFSVSVTPKFTTKCPIKGIEKGSVTVVVSELKESTCTQTLCMEETPYNFPLLPCVLTANPGITGTTEPSSFKILGGVAGTKMSEISYKIGSSGCEGKVKLTYIIKPKGIKSLTPMLICEDDSVKVGNKWLKCADAKPGLQSYVIEYPNVCDTTFSFVLQCIKINPKVVADGNLDCLTSSVEINAGGSTFSPNSGGVASYLWSTGETGKSIKVTTKGTYTVTISYEYTLNTANGSVTRKCSKVKSVVVTGSGAMPEALTPVAMNPYPCLGDTATYAVTPNPQTTYNWIITGGTPATGTGSSIKVNWGTTPPFKVCVNAKNICGESPDGCIDVPLNASLKTPKISGPTAICKGDSMTTYSVPDLTTPSSKYVWTLPTGASLVGKMDSNVIKVKWAANAQSGTISLVVSDKCGAAPAATINVVINQPPPVATGIDGTLNTCRNDKHDYTVKPLVPFAMDYNWTVKGGTITSSITGDSTKTITVQWTKVSADNEVCISAVNNCDNTGQKFCIKVNTQDYPQPKAGSDKSVCGLTTKLNGSVILAGSGNTGKWTQVTGVGVAIFNKDTEPKTDVTVDKCGSYKFVWTETNVAGCFGKDTVMVTFSQNPAVNSPTVSCEPATKTLKFAFDVVGCLPPYIVSVIKPTGVTSTTLSTAPFTYTTPSIPDTNNILQFRIQSGACSTNFMDTVSCNCITVAGEMDLQATQSACSVGGTKLKGTHKTGTETKDNDVTAYILYEGTATAYTKIISKNKTGEFSFDAATMECGKIYYIAFQVGNDDGNGFPDEKDQCLKTTTNNQAVRWDCVPKPNAGTNATICGLSYVLGATPPAAGVTGIWTSTNGATFAPNNSPTATVTIPPPAGNYKFFWVESNGKCKDSASVNVTFTESNITSSPNKFTCDNSKENYNVSFDVSGGTGPYTVTDANNVVLTTLSTAPYKFTSALIPSGSSYSFKVFDVTNCDTLKVDGSFACGCKTSVGSFSLKNEVCVGSPIKAVRAQNDVFDATDTWEFILADGLTNPKDPAFSGAIITRNQTGEFAFDAQKMQCDKTYKLVYIVGNKIGVGTSVSFNDPCLSVSSKDVKFICIPNTTSSIVKVDTCNKVVTLNSTGKIGIWSVTPANSGITFTDPTSPQGTANNVTWGNYNFTWTESNQGCKDSSLANLNLISPSNLTYKNVVACSNTNKEYTLSVELSGKAPFTLDQAAATISGTINGNIFTSNPIQSGKKVTLSFKDALSCIPVSYEYDHTCPCESNAGEMDATQIKLCQGIDAEVSAPAASSGVKLDGDDTFEFILHEGDGKNLSNVKIRNKTGKFKFDPATLQYGKLYYISYVVGDNKSNQVDLADSCKDISKGTPVIWNPSPTITIADDATICKGGSTVIKLAMTGQPDFTIFYSANGPQTPLVSKNTFAEIPSNVTETTVYEFTKVTDANGCFVDLNKKITITVNEPPKAGFPSPDRRLCFGTNQTINLNTEVTGGDAGGTWSVSPATNFDPATGEFKTKSAAPGSYTFTYMVKGKKPCPDASTSVKISIDAIPNADAGFDKELNCENTETIIGGNSTSGPSIVYNWTSIDGNAISNPKIKQPTIKVSGLYAIEVKDTISTCFARDTVLVKKDSSKINSAAYTTIPPNCFGEDNGSIQITTVNGGTPPYQFSINSGPFTPYKNFSNLKAGNYLLKFKDNKGCTFQDSILVNQPYEIDVDLGDDLDIDLGKTADLEAQINFPSDELRQLVWYPQCDSCKTLNLIVKPQETTLYGITVINNKGCIAKDNVLVRVNKPRSVYIPNTFFPDSEQDRNRKLRVYLGLDVAKVRYFRVYDRWGDLIHEDLDFTRDQVYQEDKGWDGLFRGQRAQPGVYAYSCEVEFVDGYVEIYKGDVLMILK